MYIYKMKDEDIVIDITDVQNFMIIALVKTTCILNSPNP